MALPIDVGPMPHGDDLEPILDRAIDHPVISNPQTVASLPFFVKRSGVACTGCSKSRDRLEYAERDGSVDGPKL